VQASPALKPDADAPDETFFDEALQRDGSPRPLYSELLAGLDGLDLGALAAAVEEDVRAYEVTFRVDGRVQPFLLDPVPRLIDAAEWRQLERGLVQRVRALDRFVADAYGEREIVSAGVVPARVLDSCDHLEPKLGALPHAPVRIAVAGLDLVRGADGMFRVLEDNVRTPSGLAYALAARETLDRHLPGDWAEGRAPLHDALDALGRTLAASAPDGVDTPCIVLLSDGPGNSAFYEHERLARELEIPLVSLDDLCVRGERLLARLPAGEVGVDVVYRRTDEDQLTDSAGLTAVGAALFEPLRAGTLTCVNGFGTGVADDKLTHAYVEDMVRFYLGEEPLLPSVRTYDLAVDELRERALERLDELVIKPRTGHGGHGVVVAPHAEAIDVRELADEVRRAPADFVAQEMVMLSRHPTVIDGRLEPRHVDLRPFVFLSPEGAAVAQGGLTRVAFDRGSLVVNSSQNGGGKDTWVMA
jgi:uncharacterized circularly permuted ATP-grasp superfamily protein